jgi:hypothetical protein
MVTNSTRGCRRMIATIILEIYEGLIWLKLTPVRDKSGRVSCFSLRLPKVKGRS